MTSALTIILSLIALIWASRHFQISRAGRVLPPLHSSMYAASSAASLPRISVLVAAKDEQANIEGCARSLLQQDYPDFELIVIDDRSGDRTGAIIDSIAAENPKMRALHVKELRIGWFGKNNAMREGVEKSNGEWLCFSDADCVQLSRRTLTIAMRYAQDVQADFLSVLPLFDVRGPWEKIIQPACGGIMMLWFNPLKVNDPRSRAAYANGAFMLISRRAYETIGGHEPVKTEVNEDMHMARRAKAAGLSLRVVSNDDLYQVRMYEGFSQAWRGWSRIFYGCFGSFARLAISLVAVTIISLSPWVIWLTLAAGRGLGLSATPPVRILEYVAAAACVLQISVMVRFYRLGHVKPWYGVTYPLGAAIGAGMLISAIRRLGGRGTTTWRGTMYRGDRVEASGGGN